jgi:hypothetical protein
MATGARSFWQDFYIRILAQIIIFSNSLKYQIDKLAASPNTRPPMLRIQKIRQD